MELDTLHQYCFKKGSETFKVEYFITTKAVGHQVSEPGKLWLVVFIEGSEEHQFCLPKSIAIVKQPKEIIEVIVRRETLHYLQRRSSPQSAFTDLGMEGV